MRSPYPTSVLRGAEVRCENAGVGSVRAIDRRGPKKLFEVSMRSPVTKLPITNHVVGRKTHQDSGQSECAESEAGEL
jgi:hypothetical protein